MIVTLQAGDGSGRTATVNASGQIETSVGNTVATTVGNTVTTTPSPLSAYRTSATVGTSSGTLVSARSGRRGLWVQNRHATNSVYLRFEAAAATTSDWLLPPGGEFRAESINYEGEVRAIASGADTTVLVVEFAS
ncbi:MAG: hypothetical protein HUU06_00395 [Planctomycetaceae bacterium]|nr:hypothetical protein [Planctomycetota bacterium]NUN51234.1 hypothetical protein [Planctomycetaceae bacterium]